MTLPDNCTNPGNVSSFKCQPINSGKYNISCLITDQNNNQFTVTQLLIINPFTMYIFATKTNPKEPTQNNLYYAISGAGDFTNLSWQSLGGIIIGDPASVVDSTGNVYVFGVGTDKALWYRKYNINTSIWENWISKGGIASSNPSCSIFNNSLYVMVRGTANDFWYIQYNLGTATWNNWAQISGNFSSGPSIS